MTAAQALTMPFYHPVPEEALMSALEQIVKQTDTPGPDLYLKHC
jgi:dihydrolipoamide dehydrogenase